jgi:Ankyrin repeat
MASPTSAPELYKLVQEENWTKVLQRASSETTEAQYVEPNTHVTPLHLAVLCRKTSNPAARLAAIRALVVAAPDSSLEKTADLGNTPLHYACNSVDEKGMEDDLAIIKVMLEMSPKAATIVNKHGHSPLDVHIIAVSKIKRQSDLLSFRRPKKSKSPTPTSILKTLLEHDLVGASLSRPLDVLFECNSLAVLEQVALEEAQASSSKLRARRQARSSGESAASAVSSGSTNFANFWVWEWAIIMLKSEILRAKPSKNKSSVPAFAALHVSASVKDCPLPFLMLAMRAYPTQVRNPDIQTGNLPLHTVAGWDVSDPASISRKSMALSALVSEYPQATKIRNKQGKTPLSMALETGTSWDSGVRRLTTFQREGSFKQDERGRREKTQ